MRNMCKSCKIAQPLQVDYGKANKILSRTSFRPRAATAAAQHASSSLQGLLAALTDGWTRTSHVGMKRTGRGDAGEAPDKKPQAYQNRPDARPAESDADIAAATHGLHVLLWNCQSYFWHSTEQ